MNQYDDEYSVLLTWFEGWAIQVSGEILNLDYLAVIGLCPGNWRHFVWLHGKLILGEENGEQRLLELRNDFEHQGKL